MRRIAEFRCIKCGAEWSQDRPSSRVYTTQEATELNHGCLECGSLYVKWVNYEEWIDG